MRVRKLFLVWVAVTDGRCKERKTKRNGIYDVNQIIGTKITTAKRSLLRPGFFPESGEISLCLRIERRTYASAGALGRTLEFHAPRAASKFQLEYAAASCGESFIHPLLPRIAKLPRGPKVAQRMKRIPSDHPGLRIAAIYAIVAFLWVALSDRALAWLGHSQAEIAQLQSTKDIAFVIISTLVLAVLLHREYRDRTAANEAAARNRERLASALEQAGARAQEWHALIDAVPAAVLVAHDVHCSRVTGNAEAVRIFGGGRADSAGGGLSMVRTEGIRLIREGRELLLNAFPLHAAASSGREIRDFKCTLVNEGEPDRLLVATAVPLPNQKGEPRGAVAAFIDITERNADESRLREQASLIDRAREAMVVHDLDGRISYWNPSAARLYGWTAEEAREMRAENVFFQGKTAPQQAMDSLFDFGAWLGELPQTDRKGRAFTVEAHWTLLRDADERPRRVFCIHTDITDRKALEEQFLRAQRLESIGRLASGIAHDLNNVLAPVLMALGAFRTKLKDHDSIELLDAAETSVNRGSDLLRQILLLSRGERGKRLALDLKPMFNELRRFMFETFPKSITTEIDCPDSLWPITANPSQMHQILLNLCVNARDAMSDGGTLRLRASNKDFKTKFAKKLGIEPGRHVVIEVEDTGEGIPEELISKVFDPFFTTKDVGKGTGLGLTTVASLVRAHGGSVDIASELGKGTTFTIRMPASSKIGAPAEEEIARKTAPGRGEWILVVDDEPAVLKVIRSTLLRSGYHVHEASSGALAMKIIADDNNRVDLLISDIVMPGIDGWTLMRQAKQVAPSLRILAMTGHTEHIRDNAAKMGCEVLTKPFSVAALLTTIRSALDAKPSRATD
jgi:PAS domain S-box-containing protein